MKKTISFGEFKDDLVLISNYGSDEVIWLFEFLIYREKSITTILGVKKELKALLENFSKREIDEGSWNYRTLKNLKNMWNLVEGNINWRDYAMGQV